MIRLLAAIAISACLAGAASAQALTLQPVGTFDEPIFVTSDPGNPNRLFVVERAGRVVESEAGTSSVLADIRSTVGCGGECSGERGLLSIALAPDFDSSGRIFLFYAEDQGAGAIHIAEMKASGSFAPSSSLRNVLTIPHPEDSNHYGGQLQFGPEGDLFISTGDGGGADDEHENAQNLGSLLGKILRIDPDPSGVLPYTVPAGNPFVEDGEARPEIWSYGLRNPFRFSFDRAGGALTIGDVGQDRREEVDYAPSPGRGAGDDFGWNCREGFLPGPAPAESGCASAPALTEPIFDYPHEAESGATCEGAIIGGYVARGPGLGSAYGRYVYGDYCRGKIRSLLPTLPLASDDRSENLTVANLRSFGEDSCGRLYAVSGNGPVYRIAGPEQASCPSASASSLAPSFIGIRATSRRVLRNRRVLVSVWVNPCANRHGDPVSLWRGGRRLGTRHLDRVCSARFRPRIAHRWRFFATVRPDERYEGATSRRLTIKVRHRHRRQRPS